jgi:hypothetical protein
MVSAANEVTANEMADEAGIPRIPNPLRGHAPQQDLPNTVMDQNPTYGGASNCKTRTHDDC